MVALLSEGKKILGTNMMLRMVLGHNKVVRVSLGPNRIMRRVRGIT